MCEGLFDPKTTFSVARVQTDRQTNRQTDTHQTDTKVNTEDTLSWFQEFFLQPIIKDRSNIFSFPCPKDHSTQKLGSYVKRCAL